MSKQAITWIELINKKISERKAKGLSAGVGDVTGEAKPEWDKIKAGKHDKYVQGKATRKAKKGKKGKKGKKQRKSKKVKPGHKGAPSKTRPGHIDFRTHKGDKYYNRDGHRQDENIEGEKGRPYERRRKAATLSELGKRVEKLEKEVKELKNQDGGAVSVGVKPAAAKTIHTPSNVPKEEKSRIPFLGGGKKRKRSTRKARKASNHRATKRARHDSPVYPMSIDSLSKGSPMDISE